MSLMWNIAATVFLVASIIKAVSNEWDDARFNIVMSYLSLILSKLNM